MMLLPLCSAEIDLPQQHRIGAASNAVLLFNAIYASTQ